MTNPASLLASFRAAATRLLPALLVGASVLTTGCINPDDVEPLEGEDAAEEELDEARDGDQDDQDDRADPPEDGPACHGFDEPCSANADCCEFDESFAVGGSVCLSNGEAAQCSSVCADHGDCSSGCCAPLEGLAGHGACVDASFCGD